MQRALCLKLLFSVCLCTFILFWKYFLRLDVNNIPLYRFRNSNKHNRVLLIDTYYHRITQFLNQRNVSISSYIQINTTNETLQKDIIRKVSYVRDNHRQQLLYIKHNQELEHGCQHSCCWYKRKMHSFYNGEKDRSPTVLDRLSQIDMKLLADVHYGKLPVPDNIQLLKLTHDILPCLQNHTIIFVDTLDLDSFFKEFYKIIPINYILITGDSDAPCPIFFSNSHNSTLNEIFAGKTNIIHWFAMNCDLGNNQQWKQSTIFSCIPQGISQWVDQRYFMQIASGKDDSIYNIDLKADDYWILTSFNKGHGAHYRKPAWELSCNGRLKNISKCFFHLKSEDLWKYYYHLGRSKFVFSPPGDGMDCYRTWETLYLGAIPIIMNVSINSIFDKLPVLIINNYEEVNLEMLVNVYDKMTKQKYDYRRLYKGYWQQKINSYRNSSELIQFYYTKSI